MTSVYEHYMISMFIVKVRRGASGLAWLEWAYMSPEKRRTKALDRALAGLPAETLARVTEKMTEIKNSL